MQAAQPKAPPNGTRRQRRSARICHHPLLISSGEDAASGWSEFGSPQSVRLLRPASGPSTPRRSQGRAGGDLQLALHRRLRRQRVVWHVQRLREHCLMGIPLAMIAFCEATVLPAVIAGVF